MNPKGFPAFCASHRQKSVSFKFFDPKRAEFERFLGADLAMTASRKSADILSLLADSDLSALPKTRRAEPKSVLRGRFAVLPHQNPPEYASMRSDFSLQYAKICSLKTAQHLSWAIFRGFLVRRKQTGWRLSMTASRKASKIGHEGRFVFDSPRLKEKPSIRERRGVAYEA